MKVNHVLILAAGKGTRMGEIGKKIPKVIWPIYEKSLLELEVNYAKEIAPDAKIYINLYNNKEMIQDFIAQRKNSFIDCEIIIEDQVLDIGGAIHNLVKNLRQEGNLLILNSDQFLFCDKKIILNALEKLKTLDSLLFSYRVDPSEGYNGLDCASGFLQSIIPNNNLLSEKSIVTYSGMSLINLSKLVMVEGESKFFDSVSNPEKYKVGVEELKDFEYWDFGTLKRYKDSMFKILECLNSNKSRFVEFLILNKAINRNLFNGNGYAKENSILLESFELESNQIIWGHGNNKIIEKVD